MKSFDAPSSGSATPDNESNDSSPTSTFRVLDPDSIATLNNTDTLRVLEVRPPTQSLEPSNERDTYDVRVEEFQAEQQRSAQQRPALSLVPSTPRILPPPGAAPYAAPVPPAPKAAKPAAPVATKPAPAPTPAFADELSKLSKKTYAPALVDLSSTTGVRHLKIELQKKPGKKR